MPDSILQTPAPEQYEDTRTSLLPDENRCIVGQRVLGRKKPFFFVNNGLNNSYAQRPLVRGIDQQVLGSWKSTSACVQGTASA
ncbi:hypothetical protein GJ744_003704 [Endocarpon pusillum]|uniref:Uncharacterized protein n=1 Tax=Endocarpon pusillum TaxID=364733 RepID=A0A8H7A6C9_9EURO|nr:hypothetical protein GJ744_003704 [Endocarpon pusillum]